MAALLFVGTHLGISSTALRGQLVRSLGEKRYLALYGIVALATLSWLIVAYAQAAVVPLWFAGTGYRHLMLTLMPLAFLLVVCGLGTRNPTALGQAPDGYTAEPATGILRVSRHPFLWGVALWGILHLLANGDTASCFFFGALAATAVLGTFLIDMKRTTANAPGWGIFLQRTSNLPFAAILQGRQRVALRELGWLQPALALALYAAVLVLHPWLFGVAALPG